MRKSILFVIPEHTHGGTNKSLQNLLSLLDHDKYDISVFCLFPGGAYEELFHSYAIGRSCIFALLLNNAFVRRLFQKADKILAYSLTRILFGYETKRILSNGHFDIVISFQESVTTRFCSYFRNVKTIAWVQCDYSYYMKGLSHPLKVERQAYRTFDKIVCVSKCTADVMEKTFPDLANRVIFVYNTLDVPLTEKQSLAPVTDDRFDGHDAFKIVSIGRLNRVKRFDYIPQIARHILDKNKDVKFKWYIIGDGRDEDRNELFEEIKRCKVAEYVVPLGAKENPYPYIRKSQLLVCLSIVESWSYVINEAKLLHIPVLTTDFPAAYEVVNDGCGVICKFEEISETLMSLIADEDKKYTDMKMLCNEYQYSNASIIEKIENEIL